MNKIGKYLFFVSATVLILLITFSTIFGEELELTINQLIKLCVLISLLCITTGIALIYFNSPRNKQKTIIITLFIICCISLAFGMYSKTMRWAGASVEVIFSIFLFLFACLPLIIKIRYENRKTILSKTSFVWSFTDLFAILFLGLGALFKFMHWPGWPAIIPLGLLLLVVSIFGWNISFKKEVTLKIEAEEKLKLTLKKLEEKNKLIEDKQKEILESMRYAHRIQKALMPNTKYIQGLINKEK